MAFPPATKVILPFTTINNAFAFSTVAPYLTSGGEGKFIASLSEETTNLLPNPRSVVNLVEPQLGLKSLAWPFGGNLPVRRLEGFFAKASWEVRSPPEKFCKSGCQRQVLSLSCSFCKEG